MARLELSGSSSPIAHHTISRVISGATLIQVAGKSLLIQSMSEPSEQTMGGGGPVHVLHLDRPLEHVAPTYAGGVVTITLVEEQTPGRRSPYAAAGFANATHFTDIINHEPFTIVQIFYNGDASQTVRKLWNCKVMTPIVPQGPIARQTMNRSMSYSVAYTLMTTTGAL